MKYSLKRNSKDMIKLPLKWEVKEQTLACEDLIETLREHLPNVMEGSLDPSIAGKRPDTYLNNLQSGRLGDFSKRYVIFAYDNNKVIGLLIALPEEELKLHIYSVGVIKEYRGMNVGTALLTKCINDMNNINITKITIDVHSDNFPAYNLYTKLGFKKIN